MWWIVFFSVLLIVALIIRSCSKFFEYLEKLSSDEHYHQVSDEIALLKKSAITYIEQNDKYSGAFTTDMGLVISYTLEKRENDYVHRFSVGLKHKHLTMSDGETFTIYVADIMSFGMANTIFYQIQKPVACCHGYRIQDGNEFDMWKEIPVKKPKGDGFISVHYWRIREWIIFPFVTNKE